MSAFKFHSPKCFTQLTLIFSERAGVTHVLQHCVSAEDEVKLSRKLQGIESVVERDIGANVSHREPYKPERFASIASPAAMTDRITQLEQDIEKDSEELELLSKQTSSFYYCELCSKETT